MKILAIILGILGYIVIAIATMIISHKSFHQNKDEAIAIGAWWPVLVPVGLVWFVSGLTEMWIGGTIEKIWNWAETKIK